MIADSSNGSIHLVKTGAYLNIAAETKEKDERDESRKNSVLKLVPKLGSRASRGSFQIGISDEIFGEGRPGRGLSVDANRRIPTEGFPQSRETATRPSPKTVQPVTLVAFAVTGFLLGYYFGRYSRK